MAPAITASARPALWAGRAATYSAQRSSAKVAAAALTVTGGYGYHRGPIERAFRDARAAIAMGPSNVIARDWIGKALVGLPLELFYEGGE
ncbi:MULTISPECIES: acyl-CoA dehydrogenase family protein [unclassified Bradyrhizobium]|uniref:acyl-CoA dehydrogenase family protein n=1 Tax=Bradyrhizobium sp. LCT2 TaxID=2493093 RepID=UPI00352D7FFC